MKRFIKQMLTYFSDQALDSESKCEVLENSVSELQSLLAQASNRYGSLEDQYEKDKAGIYFVFKTQWDYQGYVSS